LLAIAGALGAYLAWRRHRGAEEQRHQAEPEPPPASGETLGHPGRAPEARNARSRWRSPLGPDGRFADWMREAIGKSGVYLIRDAGTREVVYIGESHTGRLFKTLTRHLWNWNGQGSGPNYSQRRVEVCFETFSDGREAIEEQFRLIRKLKPRDNVQDGRSLIPLDDVPF